MTARRPGPVCGTHAAPPDGGTLCRHRVPPPGATGVRTVREARPRVAFAALWSGYPASKPYVDKAGEVPKGYENQCAIKVSVALHASGVDMRAFKPAHVMIRDRRAAIRAEDLAGWLQRQAIDGLATPAKDITGSDWQTRIQGKSGIVFFANYWAREGETKRPSGDHIDLWNGSRLTASGLQGAAVTFLRFGLGLDSGPGFSDLGKATQILFWEVR